MATFTISNLVAYSTQVLCLAGAAGLLVALLRVDAPGLRYLLLRVTLAVCLALPWLQTPSAATPAAPTVGVSVEMAAQPIAGARDTPVPGVDWARTLSLVLIAGIALRLLWLGIGMARLSRLRHAGEPADRSDHAGLQEMMGTRADVRYIAGVRQPVTFGLRKPVVLLPESLRTQSSEIREAVLAHELLHVQRRDWAWVLAEECARAVFWFHPAMWWLISRIQLAREEVVDALAVARTGRRRAYIEALMAFADRPPLAPAPAFARKRHLFRRMVLISREDVMTAKRIVISSMAIVALMAIAGWYVVSAFPLSEVAAGQILRTDPGPLELNANPITPENPVPRRIHHQPAQYPAVAAAEEAWVGITLRMTIDATGSVAEARVGSIRLRMRDITLSFENAPPTKVGDTLEELTARARPGEQARSASGARGVIDAAVDAAVAAVSQWRYEPPARAPITVDTAFYFAPGLPVSDTPAATARAINDTGRARVIDDKALRVGGNIKPPIKLKDVRPVYPQDAQQARIQGVVVIELRIDEEGRVSDAEILRSVPELDQSAIDAVRQWEFQPTLMNGAAIPVIMVATVQFTLQ